MKLKVCGVRNQAMVQACQDLMVDYIGLNFVPSSKRYVDLETAQTLSHSFTGKKVGVFRDQTPEEILEVLSVVDLDIVQLHGKETPEFIDKVLQHLPSTTQPSPFIWKAFGVDELFNIQKLQGYSKNCQKFLFDGTNPGSGSQILAINTLHKALKEAEKLKIDYGLAGGINAQTAPALIKAFPHAKFLDTASGVETNKTFDRKALTALFKTLNHA